MIQFVQMNRMASSGIDYKWHDWKNLFLRTQCPEEEAGELNITFNASCRSSSFPFRTETLTNPPLRLLRLAAIHKFHTTTTFQTKVLVPV